MFMQVGSIKIFGILRLINLKIHRILGTGTVKPMTAEGKVWSLAGCLDLTFLKDYSILGMDI